MKKPSPIRSIARRAINLPALLAHRRRVRARREDGSTDRELDMYQHMLGNDFLHVGYFADPPHDAEEISLADVKRATQAYADLALSRVRPGERVLDLGCGLGALSAQMLALGASVSALTPNPAHAAHIRKNHAGVTVLHSGFEALDPGRFRGAFDMVVCSESFHNVPLDVGVRNVRNVLAERGRWLLIDYYRLRADAYNHSGHRLDAFREAVGREGFEAIEEIDITANTVPTLAYAHTWASRIGLPLVDLAAGRFFDRHPVSGYLLDEVWSSGRGRMKLDALDPAVFARDKRYLLQVYQRGV